MFRDMAYSKMKRIVFDINDWYENGLPIDRLSNDGYVMVGHDFGAAYWIYPVALADKVKEPGLFVEELDGEISISALYFERYLLDSFRKKFNPNNAWNRKRFSRAFEEEGRFLDGFEPCLQENFFTYKEIEDVLCDIENQKSLSSLYPDVFDVLKEIVFQLRKMMADHPEANILSVMGP